jgi:hypothetical protein
VPQCLQDTPRRSGIGSAYESGTGVEQSRKDSIESLETLTSTLTPSQLDRGKTLAREYIARYGEPTP